MSGKSGREPVRRQAGRYSLKRVVGAAVASTLALALLVAGCVFAAIAGPALSLHARSQALHQTTVKLAPTIKTVQVNANWTNFVDDLIDFSGGSQNVSVADQNLTASQLARTAREIKTSLAGLPLPLGPGAWYGLSAEPAVVASGAAPSAVISSTPPKLEVLYRNSLPSNAKLVAGSYSAGPERAGTVAVAVTPQTAARFGLHAGSRMTLVSPTGIITLAVTAIVRQQQAGSTFWTQDPLASQPSLATPARAPQYWAGGVFADPGQLAAMQTAFTGPGLEMNWEFPLAVSNLNADQAQGLANALNRATTVTLGLTGSLEPASDNLDVTSPLIADLTSVPRHPGRHRDRAVAAVGQPDRHRRGGDPARGPHDGGPPGRGADHAAGQGRIAAAGRGADGARRRGRGPARRGGRRGGGRRRHPG